MEKLQHLEQDLQDTVQHYDLLIDENNDPVFDPPELKSYMNKWDGDEFIKNLNITKDATVLEIGVGTGRLAIRTAQKCHTFYGIDISPKTVERAKSNLSTYKNIHLICGDFQTHVFKNKFDRIYSSLTFMHIKNKRETINKIATLLNPNGRFILSIDKNQSPYIDYGTRKIKIFPDTPQNIRDYIKQSELTLTKQYETELAHIFICEKFD